MCNGGHCTPEVAAKQHELNPTMGKCNLPLCEKCYPKKKEVMMKFWIVDWDNEVYLVAAPTGARAVEEVVDQLDENENAHIKVKEYLPTKTVIVSDGDGLRI